MTWLGLVVMVLLLAGNVTALVFTRRNALLAEAAERRMLALLAVDEPGPAPVVDDRPPVELPGGLWVPRAVADALDALDEHQADDDE